MLIAKSKALILWIPFNHDHSSTEDEVNDVFFFKLEDTELHWANYSTELFIVPKPLYKTSRPL